MSQYFNAADYALALPMILLTVFGCGVLLIDLLVAEDRKWLNGLTAFIGLGFATVQVVRLHLEMLRLGGASFEGFGGALLVGHFAIYFWYLFLGAAAICILSSNRYLDIEKENHGEFYALILFSVVGMFAMAAGNDLILLFIGLELMAISTYVLVGFLRGDRRSNEAALKYLLLGAFSSGIFAYGLSLFYGLTGSTRLPEISARLTELMAGRPHDLIAIVALVTTLAGLLFKIAAVPFHMWAPDAYEGAPTSITGYMSVAGKAAAWALLLRIFLGALPAMKELYLPLLIFVALATLTLGNLAAISQNNLKRLLAYSSISHVGYMLLGLIAGNEMGIQGIMFYLLVYLFMNLGAFAVITSLRRREIIGDDIDDIAGLVNKAPAEAMLMLIFLLALAGIPPLAGFYGKYFIFLSLIQTKHYALAVVAVAYAAVALYYYLRVANAMFMREATSDVPVRLSPGMGLALAVTAAGTVGIGLFPEIFVRAATWANPLLTSSGMALLK
jgi:NADH-quinone oxidoreductase subunit N